MNFKSHLCVFMCFPLINCELFSASEKLLRLLDTQMDIVHKIDELISKKDEIFELLVYFQNRLEEYNSRVLLHGNVKTYIENPINAFKLIKRFTVDIYYLRNELGIFHEEISGLKYPNENDIVGYAEGIYRLQTTYLLETSDLSNGVLDIFEESYPMTSSDCLVLGKVLLDGGHKDYSNQWFMESLKKSNDPLLQDLSKHELLDYIAESLYNINDLEGSLKWQAEILKEYPEDEHNVQRMGLCYKILNESKTTEEEKSEESLPTYGSYNISSYDQLPFESMCRGEFQLPPDITKGLRCRYETKGKFYLKLLPFKVEELFLDPEILLFHDVISDDEITNFATLGLKSLRQCEVGQPQHAHNKNHIDPVRVCQGAWLPDVKNGIVNNVAMRASRFSGLSLENSESFQFVTYTAGGHYSPHFDMDTPLEGEDDVDDAHRDNRIATAVFYLTDVPRGGATVFPKQGVVVQPVRGTAVFWRNLLSSTEPDMRTLHGACPLIQGPKWIVTKWFHQVGQELIIPCRL